MVSVAQGGVAATHCCLPQPVCSRLICADSGALDERRKNVRSAAVLTALDQDAVGYHASHAPVFGALPLPPEILTAPGILTALDQGEHWKSFRAEEPRWRPGDGVGAFPSREPCWHARALTFLEQFENQKVNEGREDAIAKPTAWRRRGHGSRGGVAGGRAVRAPTPATPSPWALRPDDTIDHAGSLVRSQEWRRVCDAVTRVAARLSDLGDVPAEAQVKEHEDSNHAVYRQWCTVCRARYVVPLVRCLQGLAEICKYCLEGALGVVDRGYSRALEAILSSFRSYPEVCAAASEALASLMWVARSREKLAGSRGLILELKALLLRAQEHQDTASIKACLQCFAGLARSKSTTQAIVKLNIFEDALSIMQDRNYQQDPGICSAALEFCSVMVIDDACRERFYDQDAISEVQKMMSLHQNRVPSDEQVQDPPGEYVVQVDDLPLHFDNGDKNKLLPLGSRVTITSSCLYRTGSAASHMARAIPLTPLVDLKPVQGRVRGNICQGGYITIRHGSRSFARLLALHDIPSWAFATFSAMLANEEDEYKRRKMKDSMNEDVMPADYMRDTTREGVQHLAIFSKAIIR